jgi:predicted metal-binding membrane protein
MSVRVGVLVAVVVAIAWLVTWATSDVMMALMGVPMVPPGPVDLALFFALLVVMMVAMMLPSALPMIVAFRGITRLEGGQPIRPPDDVGTALFVIPYFLVWGAFAVAALLGLVALGLLDPIAGALGFLPAAVLLLAGGWQVTRTKEVCLSHCQSPMGFVMHHWRAGRAGAFRMGTRHAIYCVGCCWLFMLVLFVAGASSLLWMAGISVLIFVEKAGVRPDVTSRGIGALLVGLGVLFGAQVALGP